MLIRVWRSVRIDVVGDLLCFCVNWVFVSCGWVAGFFVCLLREGETCCFVFFLHVR